MHQTQWFPDFLKGLTGITLWYYILDSFAAGYNRISKWKGDLHVDGVVSTDPIH